MAGRFQGSSVFITGASSGIGEALARAFALEGARLALAARRLERLESVRQELMPAAAEVLAVPCDVTSRPSLDAAVAQTAEAFGGIDVAVANAGFGVTGFFQDLSTADFRRQFETNVFGLLDTVYAVLPHVRASKGRLALISSVSGRVGSPASSPYVASKFAVTGLAASIYYDLRADGVSVTCIEPGFVESKIRMTDNAGRFHEDWNDPVPPWLVVPRDRAARAIVSAIYKRKPEAVITGHGKLAVWSARHFPRTVRFIQRQAVQRMPGNLLAGPTRKKP
ncbi:MAG TPA: SDR family NAD(P)-dependent oxidoreductase [Candidatus Hydrogenedentes bacterium]|nr:SDR family NAD(P)-dependent oxidoreductase [Candidatus Hydrogenedentota bacterium]